MQTRLSEAEKERLKKEAIAIRKSTGQGDGSELMKFLGGNGPNAPLRIADTTFSGSGLEEFFDMQLFMGETPIEDTKNGVFVSYVQEIISHKIDKGEIINITQANSEINKVYNQFREKITAQAIDGRIEGRATQGLVAAKKIEIEGEISAIRQQRKIEAEQSAQIIKEFNNLRTAVEEAKKANRNLLTPTGLKAMTAAIKQFERITNPTDKDRLAVIEKIKSIAEQRINAKNASRGDLLQDFYVKASQFDVKKDNQMSIKHLQASASSLIRIRNIFKDNFGPESTFAKIETMLNKTMLNNHITSADKLSSVQQMLIERLAESKNNPERKLNPEHNNLYNALIHYIEAAKKGQQLDLNHPKLMALSKKLNEVQLKAISSALGMEEPKPKAEQENPKQHVSLRPK